MKNGVKAVLIVLVSVVATLYAVNYSLKNIGILQVRDHSIGGNLHDEILGYRFRPNTIGPGGPGALTINSYGFRGKEISARKDKNKVRVMCLGGSTTYGVEVHDDQSWPAILEEILNAITEGDKFEVINAGVPGYLSGHSLYRLEHEMLDLTPDIVVVMDGLNDVATALMDTSTSRSIRAYHGQTMQRDDGGGFVVGALARRVGLDHVAILMDKFSEKYNINELSEDKLKVALTDAIKHYKNNIRTAGRICEARGIGFAVVNTPFIFDYRYGRPDNCIPIAKRYNMPRADCDLLWYGSLMLKKANDELAADGFCVVDPQPAFSCFMPREKIFVQNDHIHYNKSGNFIVALAVSKHLIKLSLKRPESDLLLPASEVVKYFN